MIAIVLVNYKGAKDTIECVESIKKSDYQCYKIIIVDNQSPDNSKEILCREKDKYGYDLILSNVNDGFAAGNNIGISYAKKMYDPEYYLLLNNDTLIEPDCLQNLLYGFENNSNCGISIGKILYNSNRDSIWYAGGKLNLFTGRTEHIGYNENDVGKYDNTKCVTFATGCCMLINSKLLKEIGLLSEMYFMYEEDCDYCYRTLEQGYDIIYVPKAILYHKVSASVGQLSPMSQYYQIRNKFLLVKSHFRGFRKVTGYIYTFLLMIYRCLCGKQSFRYCFPGFLAFIKNEVRKGGKF